MCLLPTLDRTYLNMKFPNKLRNEVGQTLSEFATGHGCEEIENRKGAAVANDSDSMTSASDKANDRTRLVPRMPSSVRRRKVRQRGLPTENIERNCVFAQLSQCTVEPAYVKDSLDGSTGLTLVQCHLFPD